MDLLELGLLWPLCGSRVIGREMAWSQIGFFVESNKYGDEKSQNKQADRRDDREPELIIENFDVICDWRGAFVEPDLSPLVVSVRMGHTWRRKPKALRKKARAEGFDE